MEMTVEEIVEYFNGDIDISHLCYHAWCFNPYHLLLEKHAKNMPRAACSHGGQTVLHRLDRCCRILYISRSSLPTTIGSNRYNGDCLSRV